MRHLDAYVMANAAYANRLRRSEANFLLIDLGDRHDQVIALLRARGLRFRDGARWQLPARIQVHLIDEATVAPLVRALRDLR